MTKFIEDGNRFMMSDPSAIKILPTKKDVDESLSEVAEFMKLNYNCPADQTI